MTPDRDTLLDMQQSFGYTREDLKFFLDPMAEKEDPIGSMGRISRWLPSDKPRMLYDYFFQNFAQVTNPPIDPIREELVMSLVSFIGPRPDLMDVGSGGEHKRLEVDQPVLSNIDLERIRRIENHVDGSFRTYTLDITYRIDGDEAETMEAAVERICSEAQKVVENQGYNIIILSDRNVDAEHVAIPALLATGAVHHHLITRDCGRKWGSSSKLVKRVASTISVCWPATVRRQ